MLTYTGQKKDEMYLMNLEHRAAAGLQLSLLHDGGWIYGWKDFWAPRLYSQRMLLASGIRKSSQYTWSFLGMPEWKAFQAPFHIGKAHTYCLQRLHSKVKVFLHGSLPNSDSLWAPTVCSGLFAFREDRGLKRKPLNSRSTLSRRKMWHELKYIFKKMWKVAGPLQTWRDEVTIQWAFGAARTTWNWPWYSAWKAHLFMSFYTYCWQPPLSPYATELFSI